MTTSRTPALRLESTNQPSFDAILGGGLPSNSVTVIAGEPGSGKTILTLQLLFHAASQGKKCLYFTTLSEPAVKVIRYMQAFSFFDADLMDDRIVFADLGKFIRQGAEETLSEISARVQEHEPSFIAVDSFRSLGELLQCSGTEMRPFVYDLASQMAGWGATTLLVGEYVPEEFSKFAEFAVADGIIRVGSRRQELTSVREIEILKLRGANFTTGVHFFDITSNGLTIYPRVSSSAATEPAPSPDERAGTGVKGLDELLDGGFPRASSTILQGATGTGKTLLGLSFLMEGARHKERGILYTLEETPDQIRRIARGYGLDLAALEAAKLLAIKYASPVELSTDRFLNEMRTEVEQSGARRVVLDSLTSMALGIPSERRTKEVVYSLAKHLRSYGATFVMTMESEQLLGSAKISGLGVSFIADNLVQLRYVELEGHLERAISVIKARGIKVNSELRSAAIGPEGMTVSSERFRDLRGVLTGLPSPR